jgi:hypothetical protein
MHGCTQPARAHTCAYATAHTSTTKHIGTHTLSRTHTHGTELAELQCPVNGMVLVWCGVAWALLFPTLTPPPPRPFSPVPSRCGHTASACYCRRPCCQVECDSEGTGYAPGQTALSPAVVAGQCLCSCTHLRARSCFVCAHARTCCVRDGVNGARLETRHDADSPPTHEPSRGECTACMAPVACHSLSLRSGTPAALHPV